MSENARTELYRLLPSPRIIAVAVHDLFMAALAFEIAIWFRYQEYGLPQDPFFLWEGTLVFVAVSALSFWWNGLYRGIWHYASFTDLAAIARAVSFAILAFLPVMFTVTRLDLFPRSALVVLWPLLILLLSLPRLGHRLAKDGDLSGVFERSNDQRIPVLVAGAGDLAETFIREMRRPRSAYRVVGIIDDKPGRIGRDLRGVRVWGALDAIGQVVDGLTKKGRRPQRVVIATDRLDQGRLSALIDAANALGLVVARLPRITDFTDDTAGRVSLHGAGLKLRPVAVEDLLGRPQKVLDRVAMRALVEGRRVLITGAGGTIGSELVRQIAALDPECLILVDHSEYALYLIDLEMGEQYSALARHPMLADVRDEQRVDHLLAKERPHLVFHAAAYKHVPLSEKNPDETVLTNVAGTRNVADACIRHGVAMMVLISTDKAVAPTSVMGATKRMAELYCHAVGTRSQTASRMVTVRFGNVLGSTGSVVPLFQRQLASGGPLTVTHPEATRYFMTTREAVELVLQASALAVAEPESRPRIYVLDMGEPILILDLARQMIRLAGLRPDKDVAIEFTGLRGGEKLHERLFDEREHLDSTAREGIMLAAPIATDVENVTAAIDRVVAAARRRESGQTLAAMQTLLPDFQPAGNGATRRA
ncbi:MAG: polysaccharide biosynthesis protein [Alphaproteobacteria bacterium]|nr:polysaccharide biosynthesis protein [Alphaproteobacteria bacterium]